MARGKDLDVRLQIVFSGYRRRSPGPPTVGYVLAALALTVMPLLVTVALGVLAVVLLFRWVSG